MKKIIKFTALVITAVLSLPVSSNEKATSPHFDEELQDMLLRSFPSLSDGIVDYHRNGFPQSPKPVILKDPECPVILDTVKERLGASIGLGENNPPNMNNDLICILRSFISGCFTNEEQKQCVTEIVDNAVESVKQRLNELPVAYNNEIMVASKYNQSKLKATKTQCEADVRGSEDLSRQLLVAAKVATLWADFQKNLSIVWKNGRLSEVPSEFSSGGVVVSFSSNVIATGDKNKLIVNVVVDDSNFPGSNERSWKSVTQPIYSAHSAMAVTQSSLVIDWSRVELEPVDTHILADSPIQWEKHWEESLSGQRFRQEYNLPNEYELCKHSFSVNSATGICGNYLRLDKSGASVSAHLRGGSFFNRTRGWYKYSIKLTGINSNATSCQRERTQCVTPAGYVPIPPNETCSDTDVSDELIFCGKRCVGIQNGEGKLICEYGKYQGANNCVVEKYEQCGTCDGS